MTPILSRLTNAARVNSLLADLVAGLPLIGVMIIFGWLISGPAIGVMLGVGASLIILIYAFWRLRRFDRSWLIHELNAHREDMEDSADLLFASEAALTPLQSLQRGRIQQRLTTGPATDLRGGWPTRRIRNAWIVSLGAGVIIIGIILALPLITHPKGVRAKAGPTAAGPPVLVAQTVTITPPNYTGLAVRNEGGLDIKAPQGSRITWRLQFAPPSDAVSLVFHDGKRIAMTRTGADGTASMVLTASTLYRIEAKGAKTGTLHRLDAIADLPPQIKIITPDRSLSLVTPGQKTWPLVFEVSDDYGVMSSAQLHITLAQGEGENITFRDHTLTLGGTGNGTQKRFATQLDLGALGFATGDDLVAQLTVTDNRNPGPQVVRSPSLILRWPSDLGNESTGLEGLVKKTLPAYFRSQRQIIIDAEALLKDKKKISGEAFLKRSDSIGVDQRILRLRYGQFLGEEAEGEKNADGTPAEHHDEPPGQSTGGFGQDNGLEALYGHVHDEAEAATLLDPETRATLKKALDEMWQSELHLRQGHPELALPHAYKALAFIKEVQQATRIYLSRVGPELPPIDDTRRMTGKREGLSDRVSALAAQPSADGAVITAWNALAGSEAVNLEPLEQWLHANEAQVHDPLAIYAAMDAVRREPGCVTCRADLRGKLWAVLSRPPAGVVRRGTNDTVGTRYIDALRGGGQ